MCLLEGGASTEALLCEPLFNVKKEQFMEMLDPKSPELLASFGSIQGVLSKLKTDSVMGLTGDFLQVERESSFGKNVIPTPPQQTFISLMWEAMHDKTLILLTVASLVSLAIGLYRDVTSEKPDEPKVGWIEGFAILIAMTIVVLVNASNDYQKEKQFRKLNAKKEDRVIKVIRNSVSVQISIFDILVGDIVLLEPGDVIDLS